MLTLLNDIPNLEMNMFDCISIEKEYYVAPKEVPVIDYMVSVFPRNENDTPFTFVYGLFDSKNIPFSTNQDLILDAAKIMFAGSAPLSEFELTVLGITFQKSIKTKPTLLGRK